MPLFDASQSVIHYYINGTRHTTFSCSGVHHSPWLYIQCGSGMKFGFYTFYDIRTYYLPFSCTVYICINFSSVYIRNRVYFRYGAASLYRLPSNPCDFFFFRYFCILFFSRLLVVPLTMCWCSYWKGKKGKRRSKMKRIDLYLKSLCRFFFFFYFSRISHKRMFSCPFFKMLLSIDDV